MNHYINVLKKYAVFSGRANRSEFWYFTLFNTIIGLVLGLVSALIGDENAILSNLYALAVFIPGLAVAVRRLHDIGKNGWWILIALVPIVGLIVLLVFFVMDSQAGQNQYGANPKGVAGQQPQQT